jgi:hypothetical protein
MAAVSISSASPRAKNVMGHSSHFDSLNGHTIIKSEFPLAIDTRHTSHSPSLSIATSHVPITALLPTSRWDCAVTLNLCQDCTLRFGSPSNGDVGHASGCHSKPRGPSNHVPVPQGFYVAKGGQNVHPPVEFQVQGCPELGVQVRKALDKHMPIVRGGGDKVLGRVCEKQINLHIMVCSVS